MSKVAWQGKIPRMPEKIPFETEQLRTFNIAEAAAYIRILGKAADSMEELACETTSYLFDHLITEPGHHKACALVRFFPRMICHGKTVRGIANLS